MIQQPPRPQEKEGEKQLRDTAFWAEPVETLMVSEAPAGAVNLNVDGRRVMGPLQGFGQLWQKTYRVELSGADVTPAEVVKIWKEKFPEFQPPQNRFYPSMAGVKPGEVLLINATVGGMPVYTGVRIIYADDESFTVMTPEGHPESGWNTFSAYVDDNGTTVAQIQSLARADDPIYEIGFRIVGSSEQERIWTHVLKSLAAHFGVNEPVTLEKVLVDPKVQWSKAKNVWHNAGIRSVFHEMAAPLRRTPKHDRTKAPEHKQDRIGEVRRCERFGCRQGR